MIRAGPALLDLFCSIVPLQTRVPVYLVVDIGSVLGFNLLSKPTFAYLVVDIGSVSRKAAGPGRLFFLTRLALIPPM